MADRLAPGNKMKKSGRENGGTILSMKKRLDSDMKKGVHAP